MKIKKILVLLTLMVSFTNTHSQNDDTLEKYFQEAVKNNPTVNQKFAEFNAALQLIPQVGSLPDPEFSAGFFLKPMELLAGNQVADLRLMQMFPWFGTLKYAKDEMSLMAKAKFETFRDTKFQVMLEVQQAYYELYKVQKDIEISQRNLEILNTLERLSLIKFKTGSITGTSNNIPKRSAANISSSNTGGGMQGMGGNSSLPTSNNTAMSSGSMSNSSMPTNSSSGLADLYRIQIEIGQLENDIELLKNQKTTFTALFNNVLNREPKSLVIIPDTLVKQNLTVQLEGVLDSILVKNPMLSMLNFEKQSLDAKKEMVTRMGYPMVGLGINYAVNKKNPMSTLEMNGEDMIMPMVSVTIPIYRKKYNAMKKEVDKMKEATEFQYQATENNLKTAYFEVVQNYLDASRRIELYAKQSSLANQSLSIMIKNYSASGTGLTDLLLIQQQTLDYELRQIQAVADYNIAIAKLNRMMVYSQIQF
ncbi:MAG: TolC family protein [Bacteroidetes bacterium]|nr:TolC family protein [Bacteroidota bacterium]